MLWVSLLAFEHRSSFKLVFVSSSLLPSRETRSRLKRSFFIPSERTLDYAITGKGLTASDACSLARSLEFPLSIEAECALHNAITGKGLIANEE